MTIPQRKLKNRVKVAAFRGTNSLGDAYDAPEEHRAWVEAQQTVVINHRGEEEISSTTVYLNPVDAPPGSIVTLWPGTDRERETKVISAQHYREHRMAHTVLRLK